MRLGRVRLNGELLRDLSARLDPSLDRVEVDGRAVELPSESHSYLFHKPVGVVCSFTRQGDAPSLRDVLPSKLFEGRLFHVGRLDRDSSGLLLLSDDGDLGHSLLHPSHPVWKCYRVGLNRALEMDELTRFRSSGITLEGKRCAPARIELMHGPDASRYRIELREGRKRQIRRMVEALGARVLSLHRDAIGPLVLGDLAAGEWRELLPDELEQLRDAAAHGRD